MLIRNKQTGEVKEIPDNEAVNYGVQAPQVQQTELPSPVKGEGLSSFLPTIGSIGGGILGGVVGGIPGAVIGAGAGGALGEGIHQKIAGEETDAGKIASEGLWGAGSELTGIGAARLIGKVAKGGKIAEKIGEKMTNIGAKSSAKIPATADKAIKISQIDDILDGYGLRLPAKDAMVKQAGLYKGAIETSNASVATSKLIPDTDSILKEANLVLPEITDLSTKVQKTVNNNLISKISKSKSAQDLLDLKIDLMDKLKKTHLPNHVNTPQEDIYEVYHNIVDNYLKTNIPEVKDSFQVMSDMQKISNALSAGEKAAQAGIRLPIVGRVGGEGIGNVIQGVSVGAGNIVKKGGEAISGLSKVAESKFLPPIVQGSIQTSRIAGSSPQNQTELPPSPMQENLSNIPQTETKKTSTTGFDLEQLKNGYTKAIIAGDTKAATKIKQLYDMEAAYQKTQKTSTKPMGASQINQVNLAKSGMRGLNLIENILGLTDAQGNEISGANANQGVLAAQAFIPYKLGSRAYDNAAFTTAEAILRARSGAAVPEQEVQRYAEHYFPHIGDSTAVVKQKLKELKLALTDMMTQKGGALTVEDLTGINSNGISGLPSPIEITE